VVLFNVEKNDNRISISPNTFSGNKVGSAVVGTTVGMLFLVVKYGCIDGTMEGEDDGDDVGAIVGTSVGPRDGKGVGGSEGESEGEIVGLPVGLTVGLKDGSDVGWRVGRRVGRRVVMIIVGEEVIDLSLFLSPSSSSLSVISIDGEAVIDGADVIAGETVGTDGGNDGGVVCMGFARLVHQSGWNQGHFLPFRSSSPLALLMTFLTGSMSVVVLGLVLVLVLGKQSARLLALW